MRAVTFQDVLRARSTLRRWLPPTPLYRYSILSSRLGFDAWVKHENHLPIGAFKVRGGINLFANLSDAARARGVITATRGNHGLSIAWAARAFGSRAVVYVPQGNSPEKNAHLESLGIELVEHGRDFDDARAEAEARARNDGLHYIHPANEPHLIAGVGTLALEIVEDMPDIDAVIVPIGGGSLVAGTVVALRAIRPGLRIIGVQAERADAFARSLEKGRLSTIEVADTFADGLATRFAFELPFELAREHVDAVVRVSEDEMKDAIRLVLEATRNCPEGATAAAYAGAFKLRSELARRQVAIIHTGHNIDQNTLRWALGLFEA